MKRPPSVRIRQCVTPPSLSFDSQLRKRKATSNLEGEVDNEEGVSTQRRFFISKVTRSDGFIRLIMVDLVLDVIRFPSYPLQILVYLFMKTDIQGKTRAIPREI